MSVRLPDVVRAEALKVVSLRMPVITAVTTVVVTIALSCAITALTARAYALGRPEDAGGLETGSAFLVILHYGQIGAILLGSWIVYQESDNGSLRTSFLCVPGRVALFTAKAIVAAGIVAPVSASAVLGSWLARCAVGGCGADAAFAGSPLDEARILVGVIVYWTLLAVLSVAVATVVRNALIGLGVLLALVLAGSQYLLRVTPVARFLPDQAGAQLYQRGPFLDGDLGPGLGLLVLGGWVVVVGGAAAISMSRRRI